MIQAHVNDFEGTTLILVPHQDDEVLMCAGIIHACIQAKKPVYVCFATNGDYLATTHTKGIQRLHESLQACEVLGLNAQHIFTLGYADTGMEKEVSFLARLYACSDPLHQFSSTASEHTYGIQGILDDYATQYKGISSLYQKTAFYEDLIHLIQTLQPSQIFTTSRFDEHGDHYGLSLILQECLKQIKSTPLVYEAIVHSFEGDENWPMRNNQEQLELMNKPDHFEAKTNLNWESRISFQVPDCMKLYNDDNLKLRALNCFTTAYLKENDKTRAYLSAFIKADEVFFIQ